jgi:hypothetical protein
MRFWKTFMRYNHNKNIGRPNNKVLGAGKPKGLNKIAKIC